MWYIALVAFGFLAWFCGGILVFSATQSSFCKAVTYFCCAVEFAVFYLAYVEFGVLVAGLITLPVSAGASYVSIKLIDHEAMTASVNSLPYEKSKK